MTDRRRTLLLVAAAAAVVLLLGIVACSSPPASTTGGTTGGTGGGSTGGGATVVEKNFQFSPTSVTVKAGDTVTFDNQDTVPHHVFVGTNDLGEQAPGKSVSWTAASDGSFPFRCSIHPSMTGQITVGAGGSSGAPAGGIQPPPSSSGGGSGTGY